MKKYAFALILSALIVLPANFAFADEATSTPDIIDTGTASSTDETASSTPPVASSTPLVIEGHVDVPAACTVVDTDGASHDYLAASSTPYIGICALAAAKDDGLISGFEATNFSFGLFVTSVGGVTADPSSQFWALFQNGTTTSVGLTDLPIAAGDAIELQLHDFSDTDLGDRLTLHIDSLISTSTATTTPEATSTPPMDDSSNNTTSGGGSPSTGSGSSSGSDNDDTFDMSDALAFLSSNQNANGSFDSAGKTDVSDWVAIAFASANPGLAKDKLKTYLQNAQPSYDKASDFERHAMALQALGINPYSGAGMDFITPIVSRFNGTQIANGSEDIDGDDIFAIFPLLRAGYGPSDFIIQKEAAFILSRQKPNGSWDDSADMTAAGAQALGLLFGTPGIDSRTLGAALGKAAGYLASTQEANGGWGNVDSTSWVQTMINATKEGDPQRANPMKSSGGVLPTEYIADAQQSDGGVASSNRVWSTSYAVVAISGKSWFSILKPFSKPAQTTTSVSTNSGNGNGLPAQAGGSVAGAATSTTPLASTTIQITPLASTSVTALLAIGTSTSPSVPAITKPAVPAHPKAIASASGVSKPTPTLAKPALVTQTASAASGGLPAQAGNIFSRAWHAFVSFFAHLFGL